MRKPVPIRLRRYEKPVKGGFYARTVYRVTETEVHYRFETDDGYCCGCASVQAFRRWMRGCLPAEEVYHVAE